MGKKVILNVLYNLGIFLCILIAYSAIEHARYEYLLAVVFIAGVLISLKIKLIKDIKNTQRNP
jgi:phosphotransferase system  glucose/maltose/N-acetylglucosamine-specific IIC component